MPLFFCELYGLTLILTAALAGIAGSLAFWVGIMVVADLWHVP